MATIDHPLETPTGSRLLRIYLPTDTRPLPCMLWLHGGGFVLGNVTTHDGICRHMAAASGWAVASLDYRLAPEFPFPAGSDDTYAALQLLHEAGPKFGLDPQRLAIGGDSAGGTLAISAATAAGDRIPLQKMILAYPVTDMRTMDTPSYQEFADGYYLTRATMGWFRKHYLKDESHAQDPRVSPLAGPVPPHLPPTQVILAECDVLRDEGQAYADKLKAAGISTSCSLYKGTLHGFLSLWSALPLGREALQEIGGALHATPSER